MNAAVGFLNALSQALSTMLLYGAGHPARERAVDAGFRAYSDLASEQPRPLFTFLADEVVCGREPLRELRGWDWGARLSTAGVQRLEFGDGIERDEFIAFLEELLVRLGLIEASSAEARPARTSRIRFGAVGVRGAPESAVTPTAVTRYSLGIEAETVRWLHTEVQDRQRLHLVEAEAVVRSLSVAMHGEQRMLIPLLRLRSFDEYTTTHSLNVAVLAMALAESLGFSARDVRAFGVAGLLHDIGKVRIPLEILTKPGRLSDDERAVMNRHPVDGARIILETEQELDLAAVVAYEHHVMIDGGGYPAFRYPRECHFASRLVHVCDVYDALRTNRPYRDAWAADRVLAYLGERAGTEFDAAIATGFVRMMGEWDQRVATDEDEPVEGAATLDEAPAGAAGVPGAAAVTPVDAGGAVLQDAAPMPENEDRPGSDGPGQDGGGETRPDA